MVLLHSAGEPPDQHPHRDKVDYAIDTKGVSVTERAATPAPIATAASITTQAAVRGFRARLLVPVRSRGWGTDSWAACDKCSTVLTRPYVGICQVFRQDSIRQVLR